MLNHLEVNPFLKSAQWESVFHCFYFKQKIASVSPKNTCSIPFEDEKGNNIDSSGDEGGIDEDGGYKQVSCLISANIEVTTKALKVHPTERQCCSHYCFRDNFNTQV